MMNKLRTALEKRPIKLSFSLVDYFNDLFTSDNPDAIIEFYNSFKSRDQMIKWMKERPKGASYIHEVEGRKDIIVVITTADFNGKYARTCKEEIFKGLHMVFVESGGKEDFYFNSAHNVNVGIKKALEYDPKWVIFSSDDMYKIDDINVLIEQLSTINNQEIDVVFTQPSIYHSKPERTAELNILGKIYFKYKHILKLYNKFGIKYNFCPPSGRFSKLFKKGYLHLEINDFGIFSGNFLKMFNGYLYDETFINGGEDSDISLKFSMNPKKRAIINYKIGDYIGTTLGTGPTRGLRGILGLAYFNYKWSSKLDEIIKENSAF